MTLDPQFSKRTQEVFGLKAAPLTLDDLKSALGERVASGGVEVEALFAAGDTLHEVDLGGEVRHTNCALDALMLPFLTGHEVNFRSRCPHCGDTVTVQAARSGFHPSHPEAVLSLGVSREGAGPVQENACPFINLFPSKEHYEAWAADRKDVLAVMLSLSEAFSLLRGPACC
jgi:hypothetical protein